MKRKNYGFKSGVASFYVVAFSTLILVVIAVSFATVIVAEVTRTQNDDLSQSAYDAALAGVEDAKLALTIYQRCLKGDIDIYNGKDCDDIKKWMENDEPDCDMVAKILGRTEGEVLIEEGTDGKNNMQQAYTCVVINTKLNSYEASLSSSHSYQVVRAKFNGVNASDIEAVDVSWQARADQVQSGSIEYGNILDENGKSKVVFKPIGSDVIVPPVLSVQLIQTAKDSFKFDDLVGETRSVDSGPQLRSSMMTDRATVYLVPTNDQNVAADPTGGGRFSGVYNSNEKENVVRADQIAATNNLTKNLPFVVYCEDPDSESNNSNPSCSARLKLPSPIDGERNDDTFVFVVSLPYGQPETDFTLKFLCESGSNCGEVAGGNGGDLDHDAATLSGVVSIDSTGRANDLYRRVKVTIKMGSEGENVFVSAPFYAIELTGTGKVLEKDMTVKKEYGSD